MTYSKSDGASLVWRRCRAQVMDHFPRLRYYPVALNPTASPRALALYRRRVRLDERRARTGW